MFLPELKLVSLILSQENISFLFGFMILLICSGKMCAFTVRLEAIARLCFSSCRGLRPLGSARTGKCMKVKVRVFMSFLVGALLKVQN